MTRHGNTGLHPAAQIYVYQVLPQAPDALDGALLPCLLSTRGLKQGFHR